MRKGAFYPKLALGNLWRNKSTYLPYLLACIISIFTLYSMLAINMSGALNGIRQEVIVKSFTAIGAVILALFCSVLIFYTNSFLIKRRKKEIGLYSILGMEKKNIAVLLFFETLFTSAIALVVGLGLGALLTQLLFLLLLRMVRFPVTMDMPLSPGAIGATAAFFAVVFLLALLSNLQQVRLANPVELMAGAKHGEKEPKASWLLTAIGVLCLGGGYFIALYFTTPLEALMFFLVAVFLVIIGTYCLFTAGSIALLKLLRRNKNYYYTPKHFISVSGMIYRMKQNAAGLATICILSCMVLVTVSATVALNVGVEDSIKTQYPYEYQLTMDVPEDGDTLLEAARQTAAGTGVQVVNVQDYSSASFAAQQTPQGFVYIDDFNGLGFNDMTMVGFATLEDYNRNSGPNIALQPGQALLFVTGGSYGESTITVNGISYSVQPLDTFGTQQSGQADLARNILLILPTLQDVHTQLAALPPEAQSAPTAAQQMRRSISFDLEGTPEGKAAFLEAYNTYTDSTTTAGHFRYLSRDDNREGWYATNGGFLFLGIFFGVLFLLAAVLIIYYKQISEGYDDATRFEILQKVGMSEREVKKTINSQILTVFFLPLAVAVIHTAFAFWPISRAMVVFSSVNIPLLVLSMAATCVAYAFVYMLVYRRTAKTYFRLVRR